MFRQISATVLFVDDINICTKFYEDLLGLTIVFDDSDSVVFQIESQDFLLLKVSAAVEMLGEDALALHKGAGHRVLMCAEVEDVNTIYESLTANGVVFIKPPIDQSWGRRTAHFADPEGNLWEIFQLLE